MIVSPIKQIFAVFLLPTICLFAQLDDKPLIHFEGQHNFRDLGGYKTSDGRTVKSELIFRSGELSRLTDKDILKLEKLRIQTVINFLTEKEVKALTDKAIEAQRKPRLPKNIQTVQLPIAGGNPKDGGLAGAILEARQKADFSKVPIELNAEIHRLLIREAKKQYATFLQELANEKQPLIFHCSHGVHRTGTAAAILLSALGVPWKTIRSDYLLSNEYRKKEVEVRLEQLRNQAAKNQGIKPRQVDMTNINAFYILKPEYIDASLDEAVKQNGSMEKFIRQGLGIEEEPIAKLRNRHLK